MSKKKRLSFKDDFEMLYLRHEYIEKAQKLGKKLDSALVKRYAGIVHTTAKIMFNKLRPNFEKCGFDEDDFVAITNMYMLTYMALYSIQTNKQEMEFYLKKIRSPGLSEAEMLRVDRNRLINFLRQKLYHCANLFARKARNITVGEDRRGLFAATSNSRDVSKEMILKDYKKYGYRKITLKEFKQAQERAKADGSQDLWDSKGFKVFKVELLNQGLSEHDYRILTEENRGMYYNAPDVTLQIMEDEIALEAFKIKVDNMTVEDRNKLLEKFIEDNKGSKSLRTELKLARKMLKAKPLVV